MGSQWDLIVAGAGPAGCALAAKVASTGASVLLLERSAEPGQGRDWVVDVNPATFGEAGIPEPESKCLFIEPERTVLVTSNRSHITDLLRAQLLPIRNSLFVKQLAGWAIDSGCELRTGMRAEAPLIDNGSVTGVVAGTEELRASIVADCTGIKGTLRRGLPAGWGMGYELAPSDIVLARRETRLVNAEAASGRAAAGYMTDGVRIDRVGSQGVYSVETIFLDLEAGVVDILIGVKPGTGPTADERFSRILEDMPFAGEKVFGDGGPIPIRGPLDNLVAPGFVALGDSACQVIPAHGSGTASALIAADLASASITRALEAGRKDRQALWGYAHAFQSGRGALLAYYDVIRRHTDNLSVADLDLLLAKGLISPAEVYSGLIPEMPHLGIRDVAGRLSASVAALTLLAGVARAGILARRTLNHYRRYPTFYRPGAVDAWAGAMPGGAVNPR